jgi:hypothetical protein
MIEAAIVGKPVHTIQTTEFAGGQDQTLHFHYLLSRNGGPVEVASSLEEHLVQLRRSVASPQQGAARNRAFLESFVRPRGIERPVAPIVVDEIEKVAAMRKHPRRQPVWHAPGRALLFAALARRGG